MQFRYFLLGLFLMAGAFAHSQNIAINSTNTAPNTSAVLDLSANTAGGFLLPYMSTGKMNSLASPVNGLLIYDYTAGCIMGYYAAASQWQTLYCPCTGAPTQPNEVTGTTIVCQSSTYTYSVNRVNAPSYIWEVNPSAAGGPTFSGSGTNTQTCPDTAVTINWGTVAGTYDVIVLATDACAEQYAASPVLEVTVAAVPVAPTVTGDATIVKSATNNYYSVPTVLGATYSWSIAAGTAVVGSISGSTTSNTVNVTASSAAGTNVLTVVETVCGTPVTTHYTITTTTTCTIVHGSVTFTTIGLNSWPVPCGITTCTVDLSGAAGGEGYGCSLSPLLHNCTAPVYPSDTAADHPGRGARVQVTLAVTAGQVLYCYVGGQGSNANAIGADANGFSVLCAPGGNGGNNDENGGNGYSSALTPYSTPLGVGSGGGGGGASCIRLSTANVFADDILSAAGGGGVGVDDDHLASYETCLGGNGGGAGAAPTAGGYSSASGSGEVAEEGNPGAAAAGGASTSTTCGGVPVRGCQGSSNGGQNQAVGGGGTTDGDGGDGGMTSNCLYGFYGGGGGGGGGHYAGGGGCGGGGGGGYSYTGGYGTSTTSAITVTAGYTTRNGYIKITW